MKRTQSVKLTFNAEDVKAALEAAGNEGLLCGTCMQKLATQTSLSQANFCPTCQEVVRLQLVPIVHRRLNEVLAQHGLPADSLEIASD